MTDVKLERNGLAFFSRYYKGPPNGFCCARLRRLALISSRVCDVARELFRIDVIYLCNNGIGVSLGSSSERVYIDNFNILRLALIAHHRLTVDTNEVSVFMFIMTNMPDEDEMEFFTPQIAQECGQIFKKFFPQAGFYLKFDSEGNPVAARKILPFLREIMPSMMRRVECSPCQIPWFAGAEVESLEVARKRKREGYGGLNAASIFLVKARKLVSLEQFNLDRLLHIDIPAQLYVQEFTCNVDLSMRKKPDLYRGIFNVISKSLPNLKLLNLTYCDGIVLRKKSKRRIDYEHDLHHKFDNNQMSEAYQRAISGLAWHIREITKYAHVNTTLSVRFHVKNDNYVNASKEHFKRLLEDFYIDQQNEILTSNCDYSKSKGALLFKDRNTEVTVGIAMLE